MTVLSDRYDELRAAGFTRRRAVHWIADEFRLDVGSVQRTLNRAGRSANHDESVSARAGAATGPHDPAGGDSCTRPQRSVRRPAVADPCGGTTKSSRPFDKES